MKALVYLGQILARALIAAGLLCALLLFAVAVVAVFNAEYASAGLALGAAVAAGFGGFALSLVILWIFAPPTE